MKLPLHIRIVLSLRNQILDQHDLKPLALYALDDTGQRGRGIFCAVVHEDDGAVLHLVEHGFGHLLRGGVFPVKRINVRYIIATDKNWNNI